MHTDEPILRNSYKLIKIPLLLEYAIMILKENQGGKITKHWLD